jgi:hypothetical protein
MSDTETQINERLKTILARLPENPDDWTMAKAREVATLEVAATRMAQRLAAGRRVDSDRLVRLLGAIGRASKSIGIDKGRPKPAPMLPWMRRAVGQT